MKRKLLFVLTVLLMVALVPLVALAHTADDPYVTDLTADGGSPDTAKEVGDVIVWNDGENLYVKYVVTGELDPDNDAPTLLYQTHLEVVTDPDDFSTTKKGKPIPGQFPYNDTHDHVVSEFIYTISLGEWEVDQELYIAAHSVVKEAVGGVPGLVYTLPDQVDVVVAHPGGDSYFNATVTNGENLNGTYDSFCIDTDNTINSGTTYPAAVYSSYEDLPAGLVEYPENLDLVNWIINQGFVGQTSAGGFGTYTYGDVQRAIWELVEDDPQGAGLGPWNQNRVNEIIAAAEASGEGFVPGCSEQVAVVLAPTGGQQFVIQVITIGVEVPCEDISETAWGGDYPEIPFGGRDWAIYFTYTVQEPGPTVTPGKPEKLKGFGVRYRSFGNTGGDEIYLGRGDLGVSTNRVAIDLGGNNPWGDNNGLTFTYDKENDKLTTAVDLDNDGTDDFSVEYPNLASQVTALGNGCTVDEVDFMILSVVERDDGSVAFNNVSLDGYSLGDFTGEDWNHWAISGFDFTQGFTVTGDLHLTGSFGTSQEASKLEMLVACEPPSP